MDVRQRFIFDGHNSADYGLVISGENTHNAPERDTDILDIPGRSGFFFLFFFFFRIGTAVIIVI